MPAITASEARRTLFPLIQRVNDDAVVVEITSKGGNAVLMSAAQYESMQETLYLLRSPANAKRLMESIEQVRAGKFFERELDRDDAE